jgi:hypothetical protein
MKKISSKATIFYKRGFPLMWFGFLAVFIITSISMGAVEKDVGFLIGPCFMVVLGYVLMKKLIWDLVDEVQDGGDFLLVKNQRRDARIQLSNIMNVSASTNMNPPRITLRLVTPGIFGNEIAFSPASSFTLNPFAKNAIAEDLIVRVDQARSRRRV